MLSTVMTGWLRCVSLSAALLLAALSSAVAQEPAPDRLAHNKLFVETFVNRCLSAVHADTAYDTTGMNEVHEFLAGHWLDGKPGSVWTPNPAMHILLIIRDGAGCFVVSEFGDANALEPVVAARIAEAHPSFVREQFQRAEDGGFGSKYLDESCGGNRSCRVVVNARAASEEGKLAMLAAAMRFTPPAQ
ncbi:hypothetical protein BAL199_15182 [alpha proteobacterium BAL199]|nr:hypothetical protein BAL199_15182 [alpha proteobacterium BAL199]